MSTWACQSCAEVLEEQFDSCWSCGNSRPVATPAAPLEAVMREEPTEQDRRRGGFAWEWGIPTAMGVLGSMFGNHFRYQNLMMLTALVIGMLLFLVGVAAMAFAKNSRQLQFSVWMWRSIPTFILGALFPVVPSPW